MTLYEIYFSPTGGTKKVADILCSAWSCAKEEMDLLQLAARQEEPEKKNFSPEDVCIVAVPSFGGRVPSAAVRLLEKMQGGGAKAVLAAVYGNRAIDDTLTELQDVLTKSGFVCQGAVAAVAEHSIIRRFGTGRPDETDQEELADFAARIRESVLGKEEKGRLLLPGNHPYREYHGVPMKPAADGSCSGCGRCAAECPEQAIPKEKPASVDKNKCISCMHCIAVCPNQARGNDKILLFVAAQKMKSSCSGRKINELFLISPLASPEK